MPSEPSPGPRRRPGIGTPAARNAHVGTERRVRIGAKALVVEDDRVLLVHERRSDGSSFWSLPGGGVEQEESMTAGLERELAEELCCRADVRGPAGTCVYHHRSLPGTTTAYVIFRCELDATPRPSATEGIVDVDWFEPDALPNTTLEPVHDAIREVFERARGVERAA